jgi:PhzF family phenazine biosynthesis protein
MQRRLYQLDVFTTKPFAGNPLAVVTDGDDISKERMQAVAREMNLSETVFVQKPTNNRALARLRIFTTERELPLAGHPVIGTWFLLAQLGVVPASEGRVRILQQTGAGILPVEFSFHDGRPVSVTMTQRPARFSLPRISKPALAVALGLKPSDFSDELRVESVSTGIFNLMVPLKSRKALAKIEMNLCRARERRLAQALHSRTASLSEAGATRSRAAWCRGELSKTRLQDQRRDRLAHISSPTRSCVRVKSSRSRKAWRWDAPVTSKSRSKKPAAGSRRE